MLSLDRPLSIIDLEATGTDPAEARIIQVAIARLVPDDTEGAVVERAWESLIDPMTSIPESVQDLTGITPADVSDAPKLVEVGHDIHRMVHDADLCGYNALRYDVPLLQNEFQRHFGRSVPGPEKRQVIDVYALEKALVSRSLSALFERYTGDVLDMAHDAMADVTATYEVMNAQLTQHVGEDVTAADLADLARGDYLDDGRKLRERDDGAVEICFGKHSGKTLQELHDEEPGYFDWMYNEITDLRPHIDSALS